MPSSRRETPLDRSRVVPSRPRTPAGLARTPRCGTLNSIRSGVDDRRWICHRGVAAPGRGRRKRRHKTSRPRRLRGIVARRATPHARGTARPRLIRGRPEPVPANKSPSDAMLSATNAEKSSDRMLTLPKERQIRTEAAVRKAADLRTNQRPEEATWSASV